MGFASRQVILQHRSGLKGRLRRWGRLVLTPENIILLYCVDVLVYLRLGYPCSLIKRIWYMVLPPGPQYSLLWICVRLTFITCAHLLLPPSSTAAAFATARERVDAHNTGLCTSPSTPLTTAMGFSKGGKGGNGNSWSKPWGSSQPGGGKGQGQFGSMAHQWQNMMSEMQAMGQMSQISQMLAQANTPSPNAASNPGASSQPAPPEAASDLVHAVTKLLENKTSQGTTDTRLTTTIKRLHELMGNSSNDDTVNLENHPAFKKMKAELAGLSDTVSAQGKQLGGLQRTADETHNAIKDMFSEMRSFMGGDQPKGPQGGQLGPPSPGPPTGTSPFKGKGAPPEEAAVDLPLFGADVSINAHEEGLATSGIGADRSLVQPLAQSVKDANDQLPFAMWWTSLQKCKSLPQWRTKFVSLGAVEADVKNLGFKQIGEPIYSRVTEEGTIANKSLQSIELP